VGFVLGFAFAIVGTKVVIAYGVDRYRSQFDGPLYRWTMRLLALLLIGLAAQFGFEGMAALFKTA
jgi:multisubunit Na+/H+ antiporter MnhB subunit